MFILPLPLRVSSGILLRCPFWPFWCWSGRMMRHMLHARRRRWLPSLDGQNVGGWAEDAPKLDGGDEYLAYSPATLPLQLQSIRCQWGWYLPFFPPLAPFSPPLSPRSRRSSSPPSPRSWRSFSPLSSGSRRSSSPSGAIPCWFSLRITLRGGGSSSRSCQLGAWGRCFIIRCMLAFYFGVKQPVVDDVFSASFRIMASVFSPPARWGLLDFMSVASRLPPSASAFRLRLPPPPSASCLLLPPPPSSSSSSSCSTATLGDSVLCRTSTTWTTTIPAQCSLPDLNDDHPRPVFPAGPQPRVSPPSVPCRTSTTTIHAQCSLPDLNREYPRQKICHIECQIEC